MSAHEFPPAETNTDMRLDAIHAELRAIRDLLTPAVPVTPNDGETVELRESVAPPQPEKPRRRQ